MCQVLNVSAMQAEMHLTCTGEWALVLPDACFTQKHVCVVQNTSKGVDDDLFDMLLLVEGVKKRAAARVTVSKYHL